MSKRIYAIHNSLDLGFSDYFPRKNLGADCITVRVKIGHQVATTQGLYLRNAVNSGFPVRILRVDPEWRSLKSDPEFQRLIAANKQRERGLNPDV